MSDGPTIESIAADVIYSVVLEARNRFNASADLLVTEALDKHVPTTPAEIAEIVADCPELLEDTIIAENIHPADHLSVKRFVHNAIWHRVQKLAEEKLSDRGDYACNRQRLAVLVDRQDRGLASPSDDAEHAILSAAVEVAESLRKQ